MYKSRKILAIIPARAGSKGLKGKNIKPFCGKPLIYWTIREAKKCGYIDKIVVSTDSPEIARISKKHKADVPFLRPKNLSEDTSSLVDVVLHAINYLKDKKEEYDVFVLLQPTSPLRQYTDIDRSIRKLFSKKADTVVAVAEVGHPPLWVNTLPPDGCMKKFLSTGVAGKGRQAFKRYYLPNGAVYAGLTDRLNKTRSFYTDKTFSHIMPRERAVDIDDATDLKLAELIMKDSLKR